MITAVPTAAIAMAASTATSWTPIWAKLPAIQPSPPAGFATFVANTPVRDRKSTRLNSSHGYISYAVFCLKKKKKQTLCTTAPLTTHQQRLGASEQNLRE